MASAERTYVDPSALRSLYIHDDRSARFCGWRKRIGGVLPITRFGRAEIVNSVHLAVHRGLITEEVARSAIEDLDSDIRDGRLTLIDALWRKMLDLTAELSEHHTAKLGTRTLDVLHVSTAVILELTHLVSYDRRQVALAKSVGLKTLSP